MELPEEVEEFLLWLRVERGRSPATVSAYRRDLATFVEWLADERSGDVLSCTEDDLVAFLRARQGAGLATSTITRGMVAVRSLFKFLVAEELRADDPAREVELPRIGRGLPKALSEPEVAQLIAAVEGNGPLARRDLRRGQCRARDQKDEREHEQTAHGAQVREHPLAEAGQRRGRLAEVG